MNIGKVYILDQQKKILLYCPIAQLATVKKGLQLPQITYVSVTAVFMR